MISTTELRDEVFKKIYELIDDKSVLVTDDTPLIGSNAMLNSMKLVELCLILEDMATDIKFEFDWTSDAAMSRSRSMFRSAGSLVDEFINQMKLKK